MKDPNLVVHKDHHALTIINVPIALRIALNILNVLMALNVPVALSVLLGAQR